MLVPVKSWRFSGGIPFSLAMVASFSHCSGVSGHHFPASRGRQRQGPSHRRPVRASTPSPPPRDTRWGNPTLSQVTHPAQVRPTHKSNSQVPRVRAQKRKRRHRVACLSPWEAQRLKIIHFLYIEGSNADHSLSPSHVS